MTATTDPSTTTLRPDLVGQLPGRIARLPIYRGMPVPYFVPWIDGVPEFRMGDGDKMVQAVREQRCWVCGDFLGRYFTFVLGSMCGLNRVSAEPPSHLECAQFSARFCPFLSRPAMERRRNDGSAVEDMGARPAGVMIERNPGVVLLWTCRDYRIVRDPAGGKLFRIGDHTSIEWWAEGRAATRAEVMESVRTGLPALQRLAVGEDEQAELAACLARLETLYPPEGGTADV